MTVMNESTGISIVLPAAHCDLNLSVSQKGYLNSVGFLGKLLSSFFWFEISIFFPQEFHCPQYCGVT
jgi:hypothetical protein